MPARAKKKHFNETFISSSLGLRRNMGLKSLRLAGTTLAAV
jgi:hypothetical protein